MFFSYDGGIYRHSIFGMPIENEQKQIVGYKPHVTRCKKGGGVVENVHDYFLQLRVKCFSTEKLAREYAIEFLIDVDYDPVNSKRFDLSDLDKATEAIGTLKMYEQILPDPNIYENNIYQVFNKDSYMNFKKVKYVDKIKNEYRFAWVPDIFK